jgi:hypothetical protein
VPEAAFRLSRDALSMRCVGRFRDAFAERYDAGSSNRATSMTTKKSLPALALLSVCCLAACGTVNTVRWAYGKPNVFEEPSSVSESVGWRAWIGAPVIVGGVVWDVVTWPFQLVFGVWPMWGDSSQHLKPSDV